MDEQMTLVYLAGFFDGDGGIIIARGLNWRGNPAFNLGINWTGCDRRPLDLARSLFGGEIIRVKVTPPRIPYYSARMWSNAAYTALTAIHPYLLVKRERAQLGMEFHQHKRRVGGRWLSRRLSVEECQKFYERLRQLNAMGEAKPDDEPDPLLVQQDRADVLPYLAGFFDAEGSVTIARTVNGRGGPSFFLRLDCSCTDPRPLSVARSIFGGSLGRDSRERAGCRTVYRLGMSANTAAAALTEMLPYLRTKREQAELAIEFQNEKRCPSGEFRQRRLSVQGCEAYRQRLATSRIPQPGVTTVSS